MSSDEDDYQLEEKDRKKKLRGHPHKRRRLTNGEVETRPVLTTSFDALLDNLSVHPEASYDQIVENLLPEYLQTRLALQNASVEDDGHGNRLRPLTRSELSSMIATFSPSSARLSVPQALALRKLKVTRERRRAGLKEENKLQVSPSPLVIEPLSSLPNEPINPIISDALNSILSTPFQNTFLSRLHGLSVSSEPVLAEDWDTISPWMSLMGDIHEHYALLHPERDQATNISAPITYTYLQACHLRQVHDLLEVSFWPDIDVSDSLDYSPEQCTVVALYKRLIVGVAIMSSPQETYITYLAVKHGWDNVQIATSMLYHLINLNPTKDITLHVSANNPAMLLYNRFGFKAEEFVAGFYEAYLDPASTASKNALKLRLRHLEL